MIFVFMTGMVLSLLAQEKTTVKAIRDPFEVKPQGAMPNCDREYRFKYKVVINSVGQFIAFLKAHQSKEELNGDFKPTQEFLLPRYTLESVGREKKNAININGLKTKVETIDLQHSTLSNTKIFILKIWFKDFGESYPWQILIKASNNGHVSVKFCAGI
jgi:hypothetical protein